jgi:hypothetical protein
MSNNFNKNKTLKNIKTLSKKLFFHAFSDKSVKKVLQ